MAHFAELDSSNVVLRVLVVDNTVIQDAPGLEHEDLGIAFLQQLFGAQTRWRQTSYSGSFRDTYAGEGMTYDPVKDVFVPIPRPEDTTAPPPAKP